MIAPKSGRKNPTMGQVDESVREAGARQASEESPYASPPPPESARRDYTYVDARPKRNPEPEAATATVEQPKGFLATIRSVPWYIWVGLAVAGFFTVSVLDEEKPRVARNRSEEDLDEDDDEDFEEDEDPDEDPEPDDEDEDEEEDSEEASFVRPAPRRRATRKPRKSRATKASSEERVIPDDAPETEPEESVIDDSDSSDDAQPEDES